MSAGETIESPSYDKTRNVIRQPAVAFLLGLWLGSWVPFFPISLVILLSTLGLILTWLERSTRIRPKQGLILFGSLICGVVYWTGATWFQNQSDLQKWISPRSIEVTGSVIQPVRRAADRMTMVISVIHLTNGHTPTAASGRILVNWRNPDRPVFHGSQIHFSTRLRRPYGTVNPGGFHYGSYLERKGIQAVATVSGADQVKIVELPPSSFWMAAWHLIDRCRYQIQKAAVTALPDPELGLFLGMVIGEQAFISQGIRDAFMATGTVHIISISGSHLGLIAFLTFFLVKALLLRLPAPWLEWLSVRITATRLSALATLPLVSLYTLLAGAEIATVRSWIMIVLFLLAVWLGRERTMLTFLVLAAVIVLLHNPQALYDISFQLSYSSVLAIAIVIQALQRSPRHVEEKFPVGRSWSKTICEWIKNTWWVSLAVTMATVPIVAYHFNQIAWMGLLANFMVVPYVGFIVVPLGLISAIITVLTGSEILPLGVLNQTVLEGLTRLVQVSANVPGAEWHVASPALWTMLVFFVLLITMITKGHQVRTRLTCAIGMALVLGVWVWSPRFGWNQDTLRVTFLDVGQGDATVIELPDGQTVLIDGGPSYSKVDMGRAVVGPYLWDRGIRRIDHIIATHPQWDHVGGLPWVIKTFDVGTYWSNGVTRRKLFYQRLQRALHEAGLEEKVVWQGLEITRAGGCRLYVLNPSSRNQTASSVRTSSRGGSHLNNQSVITKLDCGLHSFLFTADAEKEALRRLNQLPQGRTARVVTVPHHGAKSSLNIQWIRQLESEIVVISAGQHNRYGHPAKKVLKAYGEKGIPIFRTDQDGAVWVTTTITSPELSVHTAQGQLLKPVALHECVLKNERQNWRRIFGEWFSTDKGVL